jgi:hypothetical protein
MLPTYARQVRNNFLSYMTPLDDPDGRPKITSFFTFEDDRLDPSACTERIGLQPTGTGITGQMLPGRRWPVPHSFWEVEFYQERQDRIETGLRKLLDLLWPARLSIMSFLAETSFSATFGSNITLRAEEATCEITAETISRLAFFGTNYIMDIFDFRDTTSHLPPEPAGFRGDPDPLPFVTTSYIIDSTALDPQEFCNLTGLLPLPLVSRQDSFATRLAPKSLLVMDLRKRRIDTTDAGVSELLDLLWPFRERLTIFLQQAEISSRVISTVWIDHHRPVYELLPDSLRRLAALGAGYRLEVFDYRDEKVIHRMEDFVPGWGTDSGGGS